jgi:hypothetical protein
MTKTERTPKLSPAQSKLLAAARAAGPGGVRQPEASGNKGGGLVLGSWHRTCEALEARKLAKRRTNGSVFWLVAL